MGGGGGGDKWDKELELMRYRIFRPKIVLGARY